MTGNNRTKPTIIGLHGVVRKAVGLGGWHWLRLENGAKCRLQRNALVITQRATGLELDSESDDDEMEEVVGRGHGANLNRHVNNDRYQHHAVDNDVFDDSRPKRTRVPTTRRPIVAKRLREPNGGPSVRFDKLTRETLEKISVKHYGLGSGAAGGAGGGDNNSNGTNDANNPGSRDTPSSPPEKRRLVETLTKRFMDEPPPDETKVLVAFIKALAGGELPDSMRD